MTNGLRCFLFLQAHYSPQNFTDNIGKALDILHAEVRGLGHGPLSSSTTVPLGPQTSREAALASG